MEWAGGGGVGGGEKANYGSVFGMLLGGVRRREGSVWTDSFLFLLQSGSSMLRNWISWVGEWSCLWNLRPARTTTVRFACKEIRATTYKAHNLKKNYCDESSWLEKKAVVKKKSVEDGCLLGDSPWWWRQQGPLKRWYNSTRLHGATTQKTAIFILIAVKTSNPIS
jgi:hypothetical protein